MTTADDYIKRAEQCLAKARQHVNRNTRVKLRQQAAECVRQAREIEATAKCAQEARPVASETGNPMVRSMNRLAEQYESESG
jgi:hypothetical protein